MKEFRGRKLCRWERLTCFWWRLRVIYVRNTAPHGRLQGDGAGGQPYLYKLIYNNQGWPSKQPKIQFVIQDYIKLYL
jgi:hypothetical protein